MTSDQSVKLQDLSLDLHTSRLEKKPLLCIESSSRGKEGRDDQQMSPHLLNKVFSTKSTRFINFVKIATRSTLFSTYKGGTYVAASLVADRRTDTQDDNCNPRAWHKIVFYSLHCALVHALRVKNIVLHSLHGIPTPKRKQLSELSIQRFIQATELVALCVHNAIIVSV